MLEYEARVPAHAPADALLILLLHGRGANRHDLFSLAPQLPPAAIVVAPEAPFAAAPWGYGPGSAWYQFLGGNRPEPTSFSASLRELETLLRELRVKLSFGKVVMGGFSQGGTLSMAFALAHARTVAGVLNFSGFVADHPRVSVTSETVMSDCGSMKTRKALSYAALPATSAEVPPAVPAEAATLEKTM